MERDEQIKKDVIQAFSDNSDPELWYNYELIDALIKVVHKYSGGFPNIKIIKSKNVKSI